ncbi:MAG: RNA 2',3'-cyclic phosphodiesterase [Candidatus Acidiferrales bacterium]
MRLFVALDFPGEVRQALRDLIARLRQQSSSARCVRPEGMHITLKFIGETDRANLDAIRAALSPIQSANPVTMNFRSLGFFPNERRPHVIWCGVEASPNLAEIAAGVERALEPLGIPRESRDFVPHLTLARLDSHKGIEKLVSAAGELKSYDFGSARETEFYLYESVLKPSGAEYRRLAAYPFVKGAT